MINYYFISSNPCFIKINGELFGECENNLIFTTAHFPALIEFIPKNNCFAPIFYNLSQKTAYVSKNLCIYPFEYGLLFMPNFTQAFLPTSKSLYYKEFENCTLSVIIDGFAKAFVTTSGGSNIFPLDFIPEKIDATTFHSLLLLTLSFKDRKKLYIFNLSSYPVLIKECYFSYFLLNEDTLSVIYQSHTLTKIETQENYDKEGNLTNKKSKRSAHIGRLSPFLLPFAFLEELSFNLDIGDFLHPSLAQHKHVVKDYFGNFSTFIPWLKGEEISAVIIGKDARRATFNLKDGLICDFCIN